MGQVSLWQLSLANGLRWTDSIAGSFFYLLTGFHALHIVGALVAVLLLCVKFPKWQNSMIATGIKRFWDFLLVVWLVMFLLIFIVQ
jgi:cytochrome c oxidase subunit 3